MRFDDRLKTVLDSPVGDARDRAVRWRQLIDLLSRARGDADPVLVERAIRAARDDRASVPDSVRAATARSIAGRPLDPRLVSLFASDVLEVAAPLLAGATLNDETRREVAAHASDEVRRFFFALEGPAALGQAPQELPPPPAADEIPSIEEAVARIEQFTRDRSNAEQDALAEQPEAETVAPHPPEPLELTEAVSTEPMSPVQESALFRWESDSLGLIAWVEGAPRGALIGRALAGHAGEALITEENRDLVARRAPFADIPLASGEPFGGEWRVSGAPAFAPGDGRFIGYRGLARRIDLTPSQRASAPRAFEGADSLRELIHEIKTPLNAIVGFAEIIDGQYLGPAHRRYRERAGEILGQAHQLLAAIDDLDFAAKIQSSRSSPGAPTDLSEIAPAVVAAANDGSANGAKVELALRGRSFRTSLDRSLSERLLQRFLSTLLAEDGGETLMLDIAAVRGRCMASLTRPASLRRMTDEQLFGSAAVGAAASGANVSLRLLRGLAQIAGGDLTADPEKLVLSFPAAR